jgi:hypothetical protein
MKKLKLNFLENPIQVVNPNLITILEECGKQISEYAKDYFSYIITSSSVEGVIKEFTLYLIAPEIAYSYRAINVEIVNISILRIHFLILATNQTKVFEIDTSQGTTLYENKLEEILSDELFNASLKFIVMQIFHRRKDIDDIKGKIIEGQARIALLRTGEKINVGFHKIEGEDVYYYTGKGLREIFKPNMTEEEKLKADTLKLLSEEELLAGEYLAKRKISDFKEIL